MASRRKRLRTRAHLLAVAAREIKRVGFEPLTEKHIASAAGITRATLYQYRSNRAYITSGLLGKYWALMRARRPVGIGGKPLTDAIHLANTYSVSLAAKNPRRRVAREILAR